MLVPNKTGLLKSFLGNLPGHIAARLAMAVEVDRLMEGEALPHEDILTGLRPMLRNEHYDRTPTPLRLFCHPFQDLLVSAPRKTKQKAAIARASLMPVWNWISQSLLPVDAAAYARESKALVLAHKPDLALERAAAFWPQAAAAMTQALCTDAGVRAAQKALGDAPAVEDAREMALLLSAGPAIGALQALLPKPVANFSESLVWDTRAIYDELARTCPDAAPYVAVIVMNRLAKPWEALRLPLLVTRHTDDTLIAKTDMGLVGEILFDRMDALRSAIQMTRHPLFDADVLMEQVKSFAELSVNIVREIEIRREGEWGRRLLAERAQIGRVMEGFMDRAPREFAAALPSNRATGADFSRHPGAEKHEMALRYARLVAGSRHFAAAASFGAKQKEICDSLCTALQRYNEDLVRDLKRPRPGQQDVLNAQFELCAELSAILFGEEEAEMLRRRARAAQASAAA
ncbi:MAG TPA: hypothetical protein VHC40_14320 [Rhizomicrobium sp.]|nr:hypothetical protein [Rhizomicrobium sp.]